MPRERQSKYFWPASAISEADMALVYAARESAQPRVPITQLIARAIRKTYGQASLVARQTQPEPERKAA